MKDKINYDWILGILLALIICLAFLFVQSSVYQHSKSSIIDIVKLSNWESYVTNNTPEEKSLTLIAVGDIMLSRGVDYKMQRHGQEYPFEKVKDYLKTGDIVFGNLESPIYPGKHMPIDGFSFWARPGIEDQLTDTGFNILSLANNHMGNQGTHGVNYTVYSLNKKNIASVGAGRNLKSATTPAVIEKNGIKIAFLAYTDGAILPASYEATEYNAGVAYMDYADLSKDIAKAKEVADFVVVSMHAGTEYVYRPVDKQIQFARKAIDNGAEIVIGHHPHYIQDVEKYKEKYIFYSLGNFIFDQMWSTGTRQGMMAEIVINQNGVESYKLIPVIIDDYAQPSIVNEEEGAKILSNIVY